MVIAREMGYTEAEFWQSDPLFFNEIAERYYEHKKAMVEAFPLPKMPFRR